MGARFLEKTIRSRDWLLSIAEDGVVFSSNANVHSATMSDIKLESLILAQNERWRQA